MRVPADKPSNAARLRHQPLFAPLALPMLGFFAVLVAAIWLALAYQQTTTIVIAVWDDADAGNRNTLLRLAGQMDVDATYAVARSPFGNVTFILPGDPMPVRPLESIPAIVDNVDNGSVLLLVNNKDVSAVMATLDIEYTRPVSAGTALVITVPMLGRASILRILPGEEIKLD